MKNRMHILQIVNGFGIGGAETKLLDLIQRLDRNKYTVSVISVGQGGPLQSDFEKTADDLVVFEKKSAFDFSLIFKVAHYIRKKKIDLVQTTLLYADLIGPVAAKLAGVKHVISWETVSHGGDDPLRTKARHRLGYRLAMTMVSKIIAVSQETRLSIIQNRHIHPRKVSTIYYGVDLDRFKDFQEGGSKRAELGIAQEEVVLLVVARLEKVKGHRYLIEATKDLLPQFPSLKIVFAGDGTERKNLEIQVKQNSLWSRFKFLGFRTDIADLLKMADIFVLPSLAEGFPNVLLEAMACAKPVIATRVSGVPEIVKPGETGFLVPAKDPNSLKKAIRLLVEDPALRSKLGAGGRQLVEEDFSLDNMIRSFEELYDSFRQESIEKVV